MYIPSSFSSESPGSGEGNDNASDSDSDSFARNSEEIARPCVVVSNTTLPHGIFQHDGNSPALPAKS
jgi:hypothetical protein